MHMRRILMVIGHRQKRFEDLRVGQRVLDETQCRLFVQAEILFHEPIDAVALHVRVGAHDNAVVVRCATLDLRKRLLLAPIGNRFDLPWIGNHRIDDRFPAFILPFLIIRRHAVRTDMTGEGCKIDFSDPLRHFLFMISIASLHVTHEARFFCDK